MKWFLKKLGAEGIYRLVKGYEDKTAKGVCTIGYVNEQGKVHVFSGEANGKIVEPKTKTGFGWDMCFQPDGYNVTFSQMPEKEKNRISHRMKAMYKLKKFLDENFL